MLYANADQSVLGYLGRALSLEMTAVQQYATHAKLVSAWGLAEDASKLHEESLEEMGHVDRVISRMLALGVAPNASMLRPVKMGTSLSQLLFAGAELEKDLIELYSQAVHHCAKSGDHDNRQFFEGLLREEQEHDVALTAWIKRIETAEISQASRVTF